MLFPLEKAKNLKTFSWIGKKLSKIFFNLKYDLIKADINVNDENYLTASFFSAIVYGIIFFSLIYGLFYLKNQAIVPENGVIALLAGIVSFLLLFLLHVNYPKILANQYAKEIDSSLIFALKSMLIQVTSGVSLFDSMINVSKAKYGTISTELSKVVKDISAGESEAKALEKLALRTKSEQLKKTSWQLLTSIRSGASLQGALKSVVKSLTTEEIRTIKNYASELNMWILIYLMLAAAVPTLGLTFVVVLSAMAGGAIGQEHIIMIVLAAFVMQIILIGFVKTRIPKVIANA